MKTHVSSRSLTFQDGLSIFWCYLFKPSLTRPNLLPLTAPPPKVSQLCHPHKSDLNHRSNHLKTATQLTVKAARFSSPTNPGCVGKRFPPITAANCNLPTGAGGKTAALLNTVIQSTWNRRLRIAVRPSVAGGRIHTSPASYRASHHTAS